MIYKMWRKIFGINLFFCCWKCINLSSPRYTNHPKLAILCVWCLGNSCSQFEKSKIESTNFEIPFFCTFVVKRKRRGGKRKIFWAFLGWRKWFFLGKNDNFPEFGHHPTFPLLCFSYVTMLSQHPLHCCYMTWSF